MGATAPVRATGPPERRQPEPVAAAITGPSTTRRTVRPPRRRARPRPALAAAAGAPSRRARWRRCAPPCSSTQVAAATNTSASVPVQHPVAGRGCWWTALTDPRLQRRTRARGGARSRPGRGRPRPPRRVRASSATRAVRHRPSGRPPIDQVHPTRLTARRCRPCGRGAPRRGSAARAFAVAPRSSATPTGTRHRPPSASTSRPSSRRRDSRGDCRNAQVQPGRAGRPPTIRSSVTPGARSRHQECLDAPRGRGS